MSAISPSDDSPDSGADGHERAVTTVPQPPATKPGKGLVLADIVRIAPAFMAVLHGHDHVFKLTNAKFDALVGGRDVCGRPFAEALPEAAAQEFLARLDRVLATGEPFEGRGMPYRRPDAAGVEDVRYVDFVFQALLEPDGTRSGVFIHGVDVTDQVRARAEIERLLAESERARRETEDAQREADEANKAKSGFLATMSHELRTPINAIVGYTQLLELGVAGPLTEQQRNYLTRLTMSGQHLLGLVNDVLDLSKIEAGEALVAHHDATTGPATRGALDLMAPQAAAKHVRIVEGFPDDAGVPFVGDEDRVRQIMLNLLSNAVKFTPSGGTVTITSDTVAETPPEASQLHGDGPWAFVRVADTGIGIAPDAQARIFDPFHQVQAGTTSYTRTAGGTGLGLAISRRLARLMGGDLTVRSTPGAGSEFTLWLPAARLAAGTQVETAAERRARAEHDLRALQTPGLGTVGEVLRAVADEVLAAYGDRLRADPQIPRARMMRTPQLEDHQGSLLGDLAQSLVIVAEAESEAAALLRDGSAIQRTIAEHHGARRHAQGWDDVAVRRDHQILREEVEHAVRARLHATSVDVDAAVAVLLRLIERAESISVAAWRRADGAAAAAQVNVEPGDPTVT